ncbi:MAG: PAS domain S-box protein [Melioribacteraceae bacterium]|nr:PAS domain S-box protein [Melioribacteraceae bacterium]MCF8355363.1 PAS domain S-box protein [Melioribacteraceae bacterium]MCF8395175.1 PAS domain S-box protein [Melioribacteraceae bacterium]MCF8420256.1 PAS domain S-box protein [Melioribacteraceae bacterium]
MKFFYNLSIKNKLIVIILFTTAIIICAGSVLEVVVNAARYKEEMVNSTIVNARLIGEYSIAPLSFGDEKVAADVINRVETIPSIATGCIYDENDNLFVSYQKTKDNDLPKSIYREVKYLFTEDYLKVFYPIEYKGNKYGTVYLKASTEILNDKINEQIFYTLLLILALLVLSYIIASKLQSTISKPILDLTRITNRVGSEMDYSSRVQKRGSDEIGLLYESFNEMLTQINLHEEERNKSEELLRQSEAKYRNIVDTAMEGIWGLDDESNTIFVNAQMAEMLGYSIEELYTRDITDFIFPEDIPYYRKKEENRRAGLAESYEFRFNDKNGNTVWTIASASPVFDSSQNFRGSFAMFTDISERKQAEKRLSDTASRLNEAQRIAHIGSWELNLVTNVLTWSDEIYRIFEIDKEKFGATYEAFLNAIHPEDIEAVDFAYTNSLKTKEPYHIEHRLLFPDGRIKHVREQCETFFEGDKPLRSIGTVQDITVQKIAEMALKEKQLHSQSLLRLSKKFELAYTYDEVVNAALEEINKIIGYKNIWVYLFSEDKKYAFVLAAEGTVSNLILSEKEVTRLTINGDKMLEEIAAAQEIIIVEDALIDEKTNKEIVGILKNRTIINIPIMFFDKHLGSLGTGTFGDEGIRIPSKAEQEYLIALANHMAVSIDRIHLMIERDKVQTHLKKLAESSPGLMITLYQRTDGTMCMPYASPRILELYGLSPEDVKDDTTELFARYHPDDIELVKKTIAESARNMTLCRQEFRVNHPSRGVIWLEGHTMPEPHPDGGVLWYGFVHDITERKQNEAINNSRLHLMQFAATHSLDDLLEETLNEVEKHTGSKIGFFHFVDDDQISLTLQNWSTKTKSQFCRAEGKGFHYKIDEAGVWADCFHERKPVIHNDYASLPHRKGMPEGHAEVIRELVVPVIRRDKIKVILGVGNKEHEYNESDVKNISLLADLAWEVVEKKQAEEALQASEAELRSLIAAMTDVVIVFNSEGRYIKIVDTNPDLLYKPSEEMLGKTLHELFPKDKADIFLSYITAALAEQKPKTVEYNLTIDEKVYWFNATLSPVSGEAVLLVARDITDRKQTEETVRRMNRELRAISNCNQTLLRAEDEQTLINEICRIICEEADYRMAWVGYAEHDEQKNIRTAAWSGYNKGYIESIKLSWSEDSKYGRGPAGLAVRTGQSIIVQDIENDNLMEPWRKKALQCGYHSCLALPLSDEINKSFGVLVIYSGEKNLITDAEIQLIEELAGDLAFGINTLRLREDRNRIVEALRESEERFRLIAENTADTINVFDFDLKPIYASPSIEKLRGITVEESMKETLDKVMTPESFKKVMDAYKQQLELEKRADSDPQRAVVLEIEEYRKDGSTVLVEVTASFLRDESSKPIGILAVSRDITRRKQAEIKLIESEQKLRNVFNTISEALTFNELIYDENGDIVDYRIIEVNPAFEKDTGLTREQAIGKKATELYGMKPDYINKFWKENSNSQRPIITEMYIEQIDRWKHIIASCPVENKIVISYFDITEKKKIEAALVESEKKYRAIFNNSPLGIFRSTLEGQFLELNPALAKMLGYDSPEIVIKEIYDIAKQIYIRSEDRADIITTQLAAKEIKQHLCRFRRKDGSEFIANQYLRTVRDSDGKPLYLEGIMEDITEQKHAENEVMKLSEAVAQSPASIIITDLDGNIEYVNKTFEEKSGYSFREVLNENPRILKSGYNKDEDYIALWKTIRAGKTWRGELLNKKKNGEYYWEEVLISPITNADGKPVNYLAVKQDITERKQITEALIEAKEKAETSAKLKSEFLAQMSHEIRTPINVVLSYSSLLSEEFKGSKDELKKEIFQGMENAGKRIIRTTDLILNMSEIQTGTYEPSPKKLNLYSDILNNLFIEFSKSAKRKGLEFLIKNKAPKCNIIADEYSVTQIFGNLIDNAIKYTKKGKVEVIINEEPEHLSVSVNDSGIGISKEYIPSLFEAFSQEEQGYTRKFEGNGLGLALVKKYCAINNAEINVESEKGRGSTFTVRLPKN